MPIGIGALGVGALGLQGLGSVFGAFGARKREKALKRAAKRGKARVDAFSKKFTKESKDIKNQKMGILDNSEDVFDRLGSFIFGDTDTLSNLRGAQEDFSKLAAGDFEDFTQETQALVSSALANTRGGPSGSFENLSAKNLFDFRSRGLQNALTVSNDLAGLGGGLINTEFGIIDNDFQNRFNIDKFGVEQKNALDMGQAASAGSTQAAIGAGMSQIGQGLSAFNAANRLANMISVAGAPRAQLVNEATGKVMSSGASSGVGSFLGGAALGASLGRSYSPQSYSPQSYATPQSSYAPIPSTSIDSVPGPFENQYPSQFGSGLAGHPMSSSAASRAFATANAIENQGIETVGMLPPVGLMGE